MTRHTFDRNGVWTRVDSHEVVEALRAEFRRRRGWRGLLAKIRDWLEGLR